MGNKTGLTCLAGLNFSTQAVTSVPPLILNQTSPNSKIETSEKNRHSASTHFRKKKHLPEIADFSLLAVVPNIGSWVQPKYNHTETSIMDITCNSTLPFAAFPSGSVLCDCFKRSCCDSAPTGFSDSVVRCGSGPPPEMSRRVPSVYGDPSRPFPFNSKFQFPSPRQLRSHTFNPVPPSGQRAKILIPRF